GKPESKQLRREEKVPCVLYGIDTPVHFSASIKDFKKLVYSPDAYMVKLEVDGNTYDAILQDTQFHPVSDNLIHADFLAVSQNKPVTLRIPVATSGSAVGVLNGGRLVVSIRAVRLRAVPNLLPDVINVDIAKLKIGDAIKIGELDLPKGVETVADNNTVVVAVKTTRVAVEDGVAGVEGEEGEEGAEGEEAATEEKAEA
ncbi:MAG: large subunit ribosomal protein L25, partial [Glaciecola sp.]